MVYFWLGQEHDSFIIEIDDDDDDHDVTMKKKKQPNCEWVAENLLIF